jgi:hypothetical protein
MNMGGEVIDSKGIKQKDLARTIRVENVWNETTIAADSDGEDEWTELRVVFDRFSSEDSDQTLAPGTKLEGRIITVKRTPMNVLFTDESGKPVEGIEHVKLSIRYGIKGTANTEREFIPHRDLLPENPIRVNQTWELSGDKLARSLNMVAPMPVDPDKATGTGKLLRVYEKNGHRFGQIELNITLPAGSTPQATVVGDSKMTAVIQYDGCIDGGVCESQTKVAVKANLEAKVSGGSVNVRLTGTMENTESELKK